MLLLDGQVHCDTLGRNYVIAILHVRRMGALEPFDGLVR
jgi:hypothetical protein